MEVSQSSELLEDQIRDPSMAATTLRQKTNGCKIDPHLLQTLKVSGSFWNCASHAFSTEPASNMPDWPLVKDSNWTFMAAQGLSSPSEGWSVGEQLQSQLLQLTCGITDQRNTALSASRPRVLRDGVGLNTENLSSCSGER